MPVQSSDNHPQRFHLSNELHARPFPELKAPSRAACLAFKVPKDAVHRDPLKDRQHLNKLLEHYGAPLPADDIDHYYGTLGRAMLMWERHTEFVTFTVYADGLGDKPFDDELFEIFPAEWISAAPGKVLSSVLVRIEELESIDTIGQSLDSQLQGWFVRESLVASRVIDDNAVVCGDFRIDQAGHVRFAIFTAPEVSPRRLGRVLQRLLEIETYKSMAMLTLPEARRIAARVSELDNELARLVLSMSENQEPESTTLEQLLKIAAEIELLVATTAFRFGAAGAYEAIVNQRIEVLREQRLYGKQLLSEFMLRRFDPAMRTCRSAQERLMDLSGRAARASNLLRTRVDVATSAQNQKVLESMNKRAELQLRLQETVEGLSVVAISYYAVNLLAYLLAPAADALQISKKILFAGLIIPVVLAVLGMTRRIKKRLSH
ncbi:MAG: DUF3422 domain-containing protein [Gammaproteobacteria bacterium]|nr:DUF3422 domain-containing protein [Gammaproteobacteria bacterium]